MYSFLKAFLVLMKLLSLSQFYAPNNFLFDKDRTQTYLLPVFAHPENSESFSNAFSEWFSKSVVYQRVESFVMLNFS